MSDDQPAPSLILTISPEPTADERDAIVAAFVVLRGRRPAPSTPTGIEPPTRWQRTARQEALRAGTQVHG